ncbi:hypothetical protein J6590_060685 [Homalodisca vitripennis]|nr:hypothetical protein J6590_060685 [Homalodisca vitripennis]
MFRVYVSAVFTAPSAARQYNIRPGHKFKDISRHVRHGAPFTTLNIHSEKLSCLDEEVQVCMTSRFKAVFWRPLSVLNISEQRVTPYQDYRQTKYANYRWAAIIPKNLCDDCLPVTRRSGEYRVALNWLKLNSDPRLMYIVAWSLSKFDTASLSSPNVGTRLRLTPGKCGAPTDGQGHFRSVLFQPQVTSQIVQLFASDNVGDLARDLRSGNTDRKCPWPPVLVQIT